MKKTIKKPVYSAMEKRIEQLEKVCQDDLSALLIFRDAVNKAGMITPLWVGKRIDILEEVVRK